MALFKTRVCVNLIQQCRQYSVLSKNLNKTVSFKYFSPVKSVSQRWLFWEKDRKGGYDTKIDNVSYTEHMKNGFKELKYELQLWSQEMKELAETDPLLVARPGETDVLWCFNESSVLDKFVTTSDSDHNQGYSTCSLEMSRAGRARFHGVLDLRVPKDGRIKKAGYCAMRSKRVRKSFKRESTYDWHLYNTLVMKVRGDGRSYLLNISNEGYYDITWNDIYHYVLYTRGGPYWQIAKIPFSKFILGSKGRLQDKQNRMRMDKVTHFGISCGDKIPGPFQLEIEYIGETDVLWCFNESSVLDKFVTTSDSDHNQGYSTCSLEMSRAGRARFHGVLDLRVPKDGRIKKAGYCAMRSKRVRKSFKRESTYDWHLYNTLVMKVRGDGRSYLLNISNEGYYDITWNDIYHYVLYTRGGPYWQIAKVLRNIKIPFSKFILGSKGRLQDKQNRMRMDKVTHFGISCGDKIPGPFQLEIEYIGLEFDPTHEEKFAYEMYRTDKYIVGV